MGFLSRDDPAPPPTPGLPWEVELKREDGQKYVIYSTVTCIVLMVLFRFAALLVLRLTNSSKTGTAPRLSTKLVSVIFNTIAFSGGLKGFFYPDPNVASDLYGYSPHSQFHFSISAGYFLWAAFVSILYRGSRIAIMYYLVAFMACYFALNPFMHQIGNMYLLGQGSTLVLDLYGCGMLLRGKKSKTNLILKFFHPIVFFITRIYITVPASYTFMVELFTLLNSSTSHNPQVVCFYIFANYTFNVLNVYYFISLLIGMRTPDNIGVNSVTMGKKGRALMKVKWFAFNLNWFDVGFTLSFGDVQTTKLKIDNSSYTKATPGLTVPLVVMAVAINMANTVENMENPVQSSLVVSAVTFWICKFISWINSRSLQIDGTFVVPKKAPHNPNELPFDHIPPVKRLVSEVKLNYFCVPTLKNGGDENLFQTLIKKTPLPKGRDAFTSVHVIMPPAAIKSAAAEKTVAMITVGNNLRENPKELHVHRLSEKFTSSAPMDEYATVFSVASDLILLKADRASLVIFVGYEDSNHDFYAAMIGMLPFRGVSMALITQRQRYGDLLTYTSPSKVFNIEGVNAARMGMFPIKAVFGVLPDKTADATIKPWIPVDINPYINNVDQVHHPTINLPFKVGALTLPMLTHNGSYADSIESLRDLCDTHYNKKYFPIVSCGETCDALGYGTDILEALQPGYYFNHKSGETYKCWENYGTKELFDQISKAKAKGLPVVIIAVGGGVNGNCIGLVAGLTNSRLIEVPTTPMHYNDATTSAKKAFSLVKSNKILSKNILGCFYIPELVFCISETFLTLSTANAHATVGESCKTMNMLGRVDSKQGAQDYFNIEGACEFASDYTKIVQTVGGFDSLVNFIEDPQTRKLKADICAVGYAIREDRSNTTLAKKRDQLLKEFRERYYALGPEKTNAIKAFLSTVNKEIVSAKAMFLAYSDPFEKYRALLFEYAHTLGHGVEAYANLCYTRALERGVEVPEAAIRLHGQCVGMAVQWAGQMSFDLGELKGDGFALHQCFVYLFNRHGGFDFEPLRKLFDSLGVTKEEFCEGVLAVVRRDNKRGYCKCDDTKSVDQLVTGRPGKMMRSTDKNAELRYLVEVEEEWQERVLGMAYDGAFDKVADLDTKGKLVFVNRKELTKGKKSLTSSSDDVGEFLHEAISAVYGV
ncbi:hypothetical protein TrST_g30 [Triparma strigata]|uniref:TLC domain-containing protein n=1 Tax=Triparma strigata TaxID=1606541 RepID=A0A9W7AQJ0_9STRA|nr:hypothetical protein TrST_g30 [Triparma strigata]